MKLFRWTISLMFLIAITAPSKITADYIKSVEIISIPKTVKLKDVPNYLLVREAFKDTPRMLDVVNCESGFEQFSNGKPKMSPTADVGIMQINQTNWAQAKTLGLDVFNSVEDNIDMGRVILKQQGIKAWTCSEL